jgi:hypothetical protein
MALTQVRNLAFPACRKRLVEDIETRVALCETNKEEIIEMGMGIWSITIRTGKWEINERKSLAVHVCIADNTLPVLTTKRARVSAGSS